MNKNKYNFGIRISNNKTFGKGHHTRIFSLIKELPIKKVFFFVDGSDFSLNSKLNTEIIFEKKATELSLSKSFLKKKIIDILIIDTYLIQKRKIIEATKVGACCLFDDFDRDWPENILVLKGLSYIKKGNDLNNKMVLAGKNFTVMNKEYLKYKNITKNSAIGIKKNNLLIQITTYDKNGWVIKILKALLNLKLLFNKITVVLSTDSPNYDIVNSLLSNFNQANIIQYKNVKDQVLQYKKHNIIIGAGGVAAIERAYLKYYTLTYSINSNQEKNCINLEKLNLIKYGGSLKKIKISKLQKQINTFLIDKQNKKIKKELIDGKGSKRIALRICKYIEKNSKLSDYEIPLVFMCAGGPSMGKLIKSIRKYYKGKIIGMDINFHNLENNSSYFDRTFLVPKTTKNNFIIEIIKSLKPITPCLLLPGSDEEAVMISKNHKLLKKNNIICNVMNYKIISSFSNKYKLNKVVELLAPESNIDCLLVRNKDFIPKYSTKLGYPNEKLIIKPIVGRGRRNTYIITDKHNTSKKSHKDLPPSINLKQLHSYNFIENNKYIIMKFIEGEAITVDVIVKEGNLKLLLARKWNKPWRFPFPGQKIISDIRIKKLVIKLCKYYCLNGLIDFDLIRNEKGIYLLEINPRPSGSLFFAEQQGFKVIKKLNKILLSA